MFKYKTESMRDLLSDRIALRPAITTIIGITAIVGTAQPYISVV